MVNRDGSGSGGSKEEGKGAACLCPYCDGPVEMPYPFCQTCQVRLSICHKCKKPVAKEDEICPHCGATIK